MECLIKFLDLWFILYHFLKLLGFSNLKSADKSINFTFWFNFLEIFWASPFGSAANNISILSKFMLAKLVILGNDFFF